MKEQETSPEEELDEMEASNFSDREFRMMIIRILNSMGKKKQNPKTIKKDQLGKQNAMSEIKHWKE